MHRTVVLAAVLSSWLWCLTVATRLPPIDVLTSSPSGQLRHNATGLTWERMTNGSAPCPDGALCISSTVNASDLRQPMDGFGGTFNRAGAYIVGNLSDATVDRLFRDLFDDGDNGADFNLGKVPIAANDFSVPVWYTYQQVGPDVPFTIDYDLDPVGGLIPYIQRAQRYSRRGKPFRLQATLDFPPWWMLEQGLRPRKAPLNASYFADFARYFLSYAQALAAHDVPVEFLSMFNEPVESYCIANKTQIHELMTKHVGPLFRSTPGAPKLTWGEQYGRKVTLEKYPALNNMSGMIDGFVDILFYHGYDCEPWLCLPEDGPVADRLNTTCPGLAEAMADIATYKRMYPNTTMWMTETCYAVEFQNYQNTTVCPKLPRSDFEDSLQWGRMIFGDIDAGAAGWIYWNYILDSEGGPWLVSDDHNNPDGNFQQPLVIADVANDSYTLTGCYYAMAHFSKRVAEGMAYVPVRWGGRAPEDVTVERPAYRRLDAANSNVYAAHFVDAAASHVVVLMNDRKETTEQVLTLDGTYRVVIRMPPVSFVTVRFSTGSNGGDTSSPDEDSGEVWVYAVVGGVCGFFAVVAVVTVVVVRRNRSRHRRGDATYVGLPPEHRSAAATGGVKSSHDDEQATAASQLSHHSARDSLYEA